MQKEERKIKDITMTTIFSEINVDDKISKFFIQTVKIIAEDVKKYLQQFKLPESVPTCESCYNYIFTMM